MKSLTIAFATAKEAIRQPAFFVMAAFAGGLLLVTIWVSYFTFGEDIKMYKDTGLTTISFFCMLLALLTASSTVADEIEGKTAITLLSKPINRRQFIVGKFLGIELGVLALYVLLGSLFAFLTVILVYVRLELKRHVSFYRDETRRSKLLTVRQDKKLELITATFTVLDSNEKLLGTFSKNYLYDILRKRWECRDRTGKLLFTAREDSIIKSILRRLFGPLFGLLRINFILCDPVNDAVLGVFNRSFTILDRYVLDMGDDPRKRIDRRLALAMGVMLDTGERR